MITGVEICGDPEQLDALDAVVLSGPSSSILCAGRWLFRTYMHTFTRWKHLIRRRRYLHCREQTAKRARAFDLKLACFRAWSVATGRRRRLLLLLCPPKHRQALSLTAAAWCVWQSSVERGGGGGGKSATRLLRALDRLLAARRRAEILATALFGLQNAAAEARRARARNREVIAHARRQAVEQVRS